MCDTLAIVRDDRVFFAKASDRDANEAQLLEWRPAEDHPSGSTVRCTYLEVPQVEHTHAVLLSRPFWMFGAEMGLNEHGVIIGNEAVFTKAKAEKGEHLTGMDLLRLALERATTAEEAVELLTTLLEAHGQGGACGYEDRSFTYDSSFLVADHRGAFVLETAARTWQVERVTSGVRSISNGLSIPGFAEQHQRWLEPTVACAVPRRKMTTELGAGADTAADLFRILRHHGPSDEPRYKLINGTLGMPCMHGGGVAAASVSTGALVAELRPDGVRAWATATSGTCTSLFKPVSVHEPVDLGAPEGTADDSLWWRHERLHRRVMTDPARLRPLFAAERDATEARWLADPPASAQAFAEGDALLARWTEAVEAAAGADVRPLWARSYWSKRNRDAQLTL